MSATRIEKDSLGEVEVPASAYYGAQTQRAVENFPISGTPVEPALVHAMGHVKAAAAVANVTSEARRGRPILLCTLCRSSLGGARLPLRKGTEG